MEAYLLLGHSYFGISEYKSALKYYKKALSLNKKDGEIFYYIG
ncbi:tetratricopeptide repeat protein [Hypnocyclicus thermotrophus]